MQIMLKTGWMVKDPFGIKWIRSSNMPYYTHSRVTKCWDIYGYDQVVILSHGSDFYCEDPWPNHPNGGPDCIRNISEMYKGE